VFSFLEHKIFGSLVPEQVIGIVERPINDRNNHRQTDATLHHMAILGT
jgi:hypothetical protein